jgi:hypothetical protein
MAQRRESKNQAPEQPERNRWTQVLEWLAEHVPQSTGNPIFSLAGLIEGKDTDYDRPYREQYFFPEEDILPRTSERPTGAEGTEGMWRRSAVNYPDVTITESIVPGPRGSGRPAIEYVNPGHPLQRDFSEVPWREKPLHALTRGFQLALLPWHEGTRDALMRRLTSAHGSGRSQEPPNPYIPWKAHEKPGDPHYGRAVEIPSGNEIGRDLADLFGLGQHTRSIGRDPTTGEPYLSVYDVWDFENYAQNRPSFGPSLVENIMSKVPGEAFNIYDRIPLEELPGPPDPSRDEIARYRFKDHPSRHLTIGPPRRRARR